MSKLTRLVIGAALVLCVLGTVPRLSGSSAVWQQQETDARAQAQQENPIKVSITTGGSLFGPPRDQYRVGQRVPVSITMTNTSDETAQICISGSLYQNRPKLLKDGQPVPYLALQSEMLLADKEDKTCVKDDLPEQVILQPKEKRVVDWFILAEGRTPMGDLAWYDTLSAGKYELSIKRRLACCDGPTVESNKISFEVVP
jgi:hypothetical protein